MQHTLYMSFCLGHIDLELASVSVGGVVITTQNHRIFRYLKR